jgi:hypothetical protein
MARVASEIPIVCTASEPGADGESTLRCMEVWGGNQPVRRMVSLLGLDAWVFSRPYLQAAAGGDVYYASSCATGRIVRLLLADVSGHGAAVGDIAIQLRSLMRSHVNRHSQQSFVREMNKQFTALSDGGSFATAIVNTFFSPTNELTLCNAGHPAPLLYRAQTRQWSLLRPTDNGAERRDGEIWNLPLGIEGLSDYEQFVVELHDGDIVLCYSDSLIEARGADGKALGEAGLLAETSGLVLGEPSELITGLLDRLGALHEGNLVGDDVTVMMFRAKGNGRVPALGRRLLGPLRFLRASVLALRDRQRLPLPDFTVRNLGGSVIPHFNGRRK